MNRSAFLVHLALCWVVATGVAGLQENPLLVGEFKVTRVVDGDTIAVEGLPRTIRFLCIDTEECEKGPGALARTRQHERDFAAYARVHVRKNPIGQFNTPMGWKAKEFAETWFPLGSTVRIEYDALSRKAGYYGRVLGYVFAQVDGRWVNYNVECVRSGMSAYFDKYGRSERFEAAFLAAEREARIHGRGIWSPYAMAYPNYDERLVAWSRRARAITRFEEKHGTQDNAIAVMDEDDWARLGALEGKEVLLFGTEQTRNEKVSPPIVELHHKQFARLGLLFSSPEVLEKVDAFLQRYPHDFFLVRGVLGPAFEQGGRKYQQALVVSDPRQVSVDIPGLETEPRTPRPVVTYTGDRIPWQAAAQHLGKNVAVVGTVVRAARRGKITFLNFDPDFRNTLSLVVTEENQSKFPEPPEKTYKGRTILVHGQITRHKDRLQIVLTGPEQIEILE